MSDVLFIRVRCALVLLISLVVMTFQVHAQAKSCYLIDSSTGKRPLKILYFFPEGYEGSFWRKQMEFTQAVARSLKIDLETVPIRPLYQNRFDFLELVESKLTDKQKPDYVVGIFYTNGEDNLLELIEEKQVPYFSINTSLERNAVKRIGKPRQKFQYWIGHMAPDDLEAGYHLADYLARKTGGGLMAGVAGSHQSAVSRNRGVGVVNAIKSFNSKPNTPSQKTLSGKINPSIEIELLPFVHTNWSAGESKAFTSSLINRVGEVDSIWTVGTDIAKGVIDALQEHGRKPGQEPLVGTFDWSKWTLEEIENGRIAISYGGHFMEGGWTMVLLMDHANGIDFEGDIGTSIKTRLLPVQRENVAALRKSILSSYWHSIDFTRFSKCHTSIPRYNFVLPQS